MSVKPFSPYSHAVMNRYILLLCVRHYVNMRKAER